VAARAASRALVWRSLRTDDISLLLLGDASSGAALIVWATLETPSKRAATVAVMESDNGAKVHVEADVGLSLSSSPLSLLLPQSPNSGDAGAARPSTARTYTASNEKTYGVVSSENMIILIVKLSMFRTVSRAKNGCVSLTPSPCLLSYKESHTERIYRPISTILTKLAQSSKKEHAFDRILVLTPLLPALFTVPSATEPAAAAAVNVVARVWSSNE